MQNQRTPHLIMRIAAYDSLQLLRSVSKVLLRSIDVQLQKEADDLQAMVDRLNERAANGFIDEFDNPYELEQLIKELSEQQKQIRRLRKMKTEQVSSLLRVLWFQRNAGISRSRTSALSDLMLTTMPTPPTFATANSSLQKWRLVYGFMA